MRTTNEITIGTHGNEGPPRDKPRQHPGPYWKRAHHDWRLWVAVVLMFAAIAIYVMSDNLALLPLLPPQQPPAGVSARQ
jgi:hypothetical protein